MWCFLSQRICLSTSFRRREALVEVANQLSEVMAPDYAASRCVRLPVALHPCQHLAFSVFFLLPFSGVCHYCITVLIHISLITYEIEHIFICLFTVGYPFLLLLCAFSNAKTQKWLPPRTLSQSVKEREAGMTRAEGGGRTVREPATEETEERMVWCTQWDCGLDSGRSALGRERCDLTYASTGSL